MTETLKIKQQLQDALDEITAFEAKSTKASSGRIRSLLGKVKASVPVVRAELIAFDKAGN